MKSYKQKTVFIMADITLFLILAYFFGSTDIGRFCFEKGMKGRLLYFGTTMLAARLISCLIFRLTDIRKWADDYSLGAYIHRFHARYHINRLDIILLMVILAAGGVLRFAGCNWGGTSIFQPDECKLVGSAIEMAQGRHLYSSSFYYPNQFTSKIAAVITYVYSRLTATPVTYEMIQAYFINRYVVAAFGLGSVLLVFLIGNYLKKHLGVIACLLSALYPTYILMAKQVTGDITAFFFLTLLLLFSLRYMEEKRKCFIYFMSMASALATLEKWHGAIGCAYIALVILLNSKHISEVIRKGLFALLCYVINLGIFAPNMVQHFKTAIVDGFINIAVYDGGERPPYFLQLKQYVDQSFLHIAGMIFIILLIIGGAYFVRNFCRQYIIFLLGVLKLLVLCFMNRGFFRWGLEFYLDLLLLAGMGVYLCVRCRYLWVKVLGVLMTLILALDLGTGSLIEVIVAVRSGQDTRLIQEDFCDANGITPDNSLSEYYTGFVPGGWISKKGTIQPDDLTDVLVKRDQIYKTREADFVIVNTKLGDSQAHLTLEEHCPVVKTFESIVPDVFGGAGVLVSEREHSWIDLKLIYSNIQLAEKLLAGGSTGYNIVIYDISGFPICEEK